MVSRGIVSVYNVNTQYHIEFLCLVSPTSSIAHQTLHVIADTSQSNESDICSCQIACMCRLVSQEFWHPACKLLGFLALSNGNSPPRLITLSTAYLWYIQPKHCAIV